MVVSWVRSDRAVFVFPRYELGIVSQFLYESPSLPLPIPPPPPLPPFFSIRAITTSKPKTRCKAFGQYSVCSTPRCFTAFNHQESHALADAINSGALLCTAPVVTLLQDNVWLPPNFVSHTLQVCSCNPQLPKLLGLECFSRPHAQPQHFGRQPQSLLGYVEMRYDPPLSLLNRCAGCKSCGRAVSTAS